MDISKYASLFLAESREHLSTCNLLLLEWEREPTATEPVGGLFRAIHTIKGMAATMGYGVEMANTARSGVSGSVSWAETGSAAVSSIAVTTTVTSFRVLRIS